MTAPTRHKKIKAVYDLLREIKQITVTAEGTADYIVIRKRYKKLKTIAIECLTLLKGDLNLTITENDPRDIGDEDDDKESNLSEISQKTITMAHKIDLGVAIRVVDKYDGDAASLQSWLDNVDVLRADDPEVPEVSFITFLKSRLVGAARGSLEGVQTLAVAKATLKEKFAVQLTPIAVEAELRSLKQRSGRTVTEFGSEIEKLATKLAAAWVSKGPPFTTEASARPVVEPIAVHTFINGLRDKSAAYLVKSRNPKTLTLAISDALEVQPQSSTEPAFWAQGNRVPHFSNHFSNRNPGRRGGRRFNNNNRGYRHNNNNQRNYNQGYCNNNHGYDNHNPGYFNNNQGYNYNNRSNRRNFNNNHNNLNNNYPNNNYQNNNNHNNNGNNAPRNNNNLNNNNNPQRRNANVAEEPQEQQPRAEANVREFFRE